MQHILTIFRFRAIEFWREPGALSWNLLLPLALVVLLSLGFNPERQNWYRIAVIGEAVNVPARLLDLPGVELKYFQTHVMGAQVLSQRSVDALIDLHVKQAWLDNTTTKGAILSELLKEDFPKQTVPAIKSLRYIDWLLPGIVALNILYNCLFGVGFTLIRYRRQGYLKRLGVTPLSRANFLLGQMLTRLLVTLLASALLIIAAHFVLGTTLPPNIFTMFLLIVVATFCFMGIGLIVGAIFRSEELGWGILEVISSGLMFLSGIWFSLDTAHPFLKQLSEILPLQYFVTALREVWLHGANLWDPALVSAFLHLLGLGIAFFATGWAFFHFVKPGDSR